MGNTRTQTQTVKCLKCDKAWQAVFPENVSSSELECPYCGNVGSKMIKLAEVICYSGYVGLKKHKA